MNPCAVDYGVERAKHRYRTCWGSNLSELEAVVVVLRQPRMVHSIKGRNDRVRTLVDGVADGGLCASVAVVRREKLESW